MKKMIAIRTKEGGYNPEFVARHLARLGLAIIQPDGEAPDLASGKG